METTLFTLLRINAQGPQSRRFLDRPHQPSGLDCTPASAPTTGIKTLRYNCVNSVPSPRPVAGPSLASMWIAASLAPRIVGSNCKTPQ